MELASLFEPHTEKGELLLLAAGAPSEKEVLLLLGAEVSPKREKEGAGESVALPSLASLSLTGEAEFPSIYINVETEG